MAGFKEYSMLFQLNASLGAGFASSFAQAQGPIAALQAKIDGLNRKQADIASYQKLQAAIQSTKDKLQLYQQQYKNLQAAQEQAGGSDVNLQNKMLAKQKQIEKTTNSLSQQEGKLKEAGDAMRQAGVDTSNLTGASKQLEAQINSLRNEQEAAAESAQQYGAGVGGAIGAIQTALAAAGIAEGAKAIYNALKECAQASIEFESAMTGVAKTTDLTATEYAEMSIAIKQLSTEIPITTTELAGVAEAAGQLGIQKDNLLDFATTMSMLSTATNMTAQEAATMAAQFANITGMNAPDYQRLGSTIVDLGNNFATTEQKILDMGQGIAAAGSLAGMSEADMMGLSAAVTSLGIETSAGSTSMSKLISQLNKAVETKDGLEDYAAVAGMTASQFAQAWGQDAAGALATFITGLSDVERTGESATVMLEKLGINEARMQRMILSLATSGSLMSNAISTANGAWAENTALTTEAEKRYATTQSQMTMMSNAANNLKASIGDALTPALGELAGIATSIMQPISAFLDANPAVAQALMTMVGIIGAVVAALAAYSVIAKAAAAASALLSASIPGLNIVLGIAAGVAALAGGIVLLAEALKDTTPSFEELNEAFDATINSIEEQQGIVDLCEKYRALGEELGYVTDSAENLAGLQSGSIHIDADIQNRIAAGDFLEPDSKVSLVPTVDQANYLIANDFLLEGSKAEISGEAKADLEAKGFLVGENNEIELTGKALQELSASGFLDSTEVTLTAAAGEALAANSLLDGSEVTLTGVAAEQLTGTDFVPDGTVKLTPELQLEQFNTDMATLTGKISTAQADLLSAQSTLTTMQSDYDALESKLSKTKKKKEKSAIQQEMEDLAGAIATQKSKVDELQASSDALNTEYDEMQTAAAELNTKMAEYQGLAGEIAGQSGGLVSAVDAGTDAFNRQAEALQAIAEAKIANARAAAADNIAAQSKAYAQAVQDEVNYSNLLKNAQQRQLDTAGEVSIGVQGITDKITGYYQQIATAAEQDSFDWNSEEVQGYVSEIERLYKIATGKDEEFNHLAGLSYAMENMSVSAGSMEGAMNEAGDSVNEYGEKVLDAQKTQQAFLDNLVSGVLDGGMAITTVQDLLNEEFKDNENGAQLVADAMEYVTKQVEAAAAAEAEIGNGLDDGITSATEFEAAITPIIDQLKALEQAYDEAYEAALQSAEGQFGLFDNVKVKVPTTAREVSKAMSNMTAGLDSQATYWNDYADNMESAMKRGVDQGLVASLSDGSTESAAKLATLASATDEEIAAMNASYAKVGEGQAAFAEATATTVTDFDAQMAALSETMQTTIEGMNLSTEASTSATSTLQAYADSITSMQPKVVAACSQLAAAASAALRIRITLPSLPGMPTLRGYASGTTNAERGFKVVGEDGPEVVYFHGGETVLNASETRALARDRDVSALDASYSPGERRGKIIEVSFSPIYNIEGSKNAAELEAVLKAHDESLRSQLIELLDDIATDKARSVYA